MAVVVETTVGDFTVDLYTKERPQTCRNFLKLCKIKYYNWNLFFTVQSNFIAQTGDPTSTGKGGESIYGIVLGEKARYYEAEQMPKIKHDKHGLISMVNCGNNMLGSQFFITLGSDLQSLDGEHCVFGEITEGLEVILKFNETICDADHRPYQDIRISHTVILEDPYDDPKDLIIPDRSPGPTKEVLESDRIGADEAIDDTEGLTAEEIAEMQKEKEAKARATILEIVGDIPDADMAPPENVLFVCKLNPVTNDDDLEIIFSRFGKIIGCEVIRDRQTGDSLQYAFIEFADRKSCEEAYFKMDNVLIDDRRIHVDFSQSVAKMRWRGKGKGIKYFDEEDENKKKDKGGFRGDKKKRIERHQDRSESPKWEKNRQDFKDRQNWRKDNKKKQEFNRSDDDKRKDNNWNKKSKKPERSRSNERNWDREERNRSYERKKGPEKRKDQKERSRSSSYEKNRHKRERSRSNERNWDREERNRSYERKKGPEKRKDQKERSRSSSYEKNRHKRERSRSNDKKKCYKERSRSISYEKSSNRKDRSKSNERKKNKKEKSRSPSYEKSKSRRERSRSEERIKEKRDKKGQSAQKSRDRGKRSRDRSKEEKDYKSYRNIQYESKNRENNDKRKKKYDRESSDERSGRCLNKKREKSRERSEEKHNRKHKYKNR